MKCVHAIKKIMRKCLEVRQIYYKNVDFYKKINARKHSLVSDTAMPKNIINMHYSNFRHV